MLGPVILARSNVIEQDLRTVKKESGLPRAIHPQSAWRMLQGIETVNMIRKG
jgi:transposase-like protein